MNNPAQCQLQTVQQTVKILNQTDEFLLKSVLRQPANYITSAMLINAYVTSKLHLTCRKNILVGFTVCNSTAKYGLK